MNSMDLKLLSLAIDLSKKYMLEGKGGPFGAVIVKNGKIIAKGWNRVLETNDPTNHAEIVAIRSACKKLGTFHLKGCTLYTSCEPCPMCLGAIYWANIDKVFYAATRQDAASIGFSDEFIYQELALPLSKRKVKFMQGLRDKAIDVFDLWKNKKDKVMY